MNAIACTGISKSFGEVRAVDDLDVTIGVGQTVALLGPNGAGKSTTINMLLGLVRPSAGRLRLFGDEPHVAVARGDVGAMLQEGALLPNLTVGELVDFVRGLYPDPMSQSEVLALAGLTELADRRTDRLSGGQTQRVRFALAVAGQPRLLVLDEPTEAMDVESRQTFWSSMRSYAAAGRTILFATHYLEEADENTDRVIVMRDGEIVADGTSGSIKSAAGGRVVRFSLGDAPSAGLDALPGVTSVEIRGSTATLRSSDSDATVAAMFASGMRVRDLEVTGADLEDAFLELTRATD